MSEIEFLSPPTSVSMADEWFDLATTDHFWIKWRHSVLLRQLNRASFRGKIALEVGCGHGLVREMLEASLGIRVDGCDLKSACIRKRRRVVRGDCWSMSISTETRRCLALMICFF